MAIRSAVEFGDGFEKIFQRLRHDGYPWNHKKVYRVYKKIHCNKRSRLKRRLPKRVKEPLEAPLEPNKTWSMDFVSDKMESGRTFRVLNILDDSNREAVAQEISMSMPAERVISIMEKVIFINGKPECIRTATTRPWAVRSAGTRRAPTAVRGATCSTLILRSSIRDIPVRPS